MTAAAVLLLGLAALIGVWRARRNRRAWRDPTLWLQPLAALLLIATLFPPSVRVDATHLTVLTPGASAEQRRALPWLAPSVVLPGAGIGDAPTADLASALRQFPDAQSLRVIGNGLPPRDLDAVGDRALQFEAAPAVGIVAITAPLRVTLGRQWSLSGRVAGPVVRLSLHDPSGAEVDAATPDGEGAFRLAALARAPGSAVFTLRAQSADAGLLDHAAVPLLIDGGERLRALYRSGTPDAEAKYWRRWAQDASIDVAYRTGLSDGVALSDVSAADALTADALAAADLAVIDDRAWAALSSDERTVLLAAVDGGLGLILKAGGPLDAGVAADWAALGFATTGLDAPLSVTLDRRLVMRARADFTAAPLAIDDAAALTPLLRADDGHLLAAWRARGSGRIALWTLLDSYRLVLAGDSARHGALWGDALAVLSRALPAPDSGPQLPRDAWIDERAVICGLGAAASLRSPDGVPHALSIRADSCAAAWPGESGWHRLQTAGASWPLFVRAADDASGLRATRDQEATRALASDLPPDRGSATRQTPLPRWPWFLAWLVVAGLLWWRERRP